MNGQGVVVVKGSVSGCLGDIGVVLSECLNSSEFDMSLRQEDGVLMKRTLDYDREYISITGKREAEEEGTEINKVVRKTLKFVKKSLKECKKKDFAGNAHVLRKKGRKY
ncbi:hypothetical protein Tco_0566504 [Tanacetum coccineum]